MDKITTTSEKWLIEYISYYKFYIDFKEKKMNDCIVTKQISDES